MQRLVHHSENVSFKDHDQKLCIEKLRFQGSIEHDNLLKNVENFSLCGI